MLLGKGTGYPHSPASTALDTSVAPSVAVASSGGKVRPASARGEVVQMASAPAVLPELVVEAKGAVEITRVAVPDDGEDPLAVLYDNTTSAANMYNPGGGIELLDFGTSTGGQVTSFRFGYATSLAAPGTVAVRFYSGTTSSTRGTYITGFSFSSLDGSPDGGTYLFTATYNIPAGSEFTLGLGSQHRKRIRQQRHRHRLAQRYPDFLLLHRLYGGLR